MTKQEFFSLIKDLVSVLRVDMPARDSLAAYFERFKHYDVARLKAAMDRYVDDKDDQHRFFPSVGEIRSYLHETYRPVVYRSTFRCETCRDTGLVDLIRDKRGWMAMGCGGVGRVTTFACRCDAGRGQRIEQALGGDDMWFQVAPLHTTIDEIPDGQIPARFGWFPEKYIPMEVDDG